MYCFRYCSGNWEVGSRESVVSIAITLPEWTVWGSSHGRSQKSFLFSTFFQTTLGPTQPPTQLIQQFFPWRSGSGSDVNLSPPTSAKFKNEWSYSLLYTPRLHGNFASFILDYINHTEKQHETLQSG